MHRHAIISLLLSAVFALSSSPVQAESSAELYKTESYLYGRFEASIRFAPGSGVVSSFFLWKNNSENPAVYWNEIDIEKVTDNCKGYSSNLLHGLPEQNHTKPISLTVDLCESYHTHAIEWTPDRITWLLDGNQVREETGDAAAAFASNAQAGMQFRFNVWVGNASFGGVFDAAILPVHHYIDWVQYATYTPGTGDNGSDFTLAWREDFDGPLDSSWATGTWDSPFGLSTHSSLNVTVYGGKAILSLTAQGQEGFQPDAVSDGDAVNDASDDSVADTTTLTPDASADAADGSLADTKETDAGASADATDDIHVDAAAVDTSLADTAPLADATDASSVKGGGGCMISGLTPPAGWIFLLLGLAVWIVFRRRHSD